MIPGVNIISSKASVATVNRAAGSGGGVCKPFSGSFRGRALVRKFLGSKEHLDWLKIDLNAAEIITVQDYKRTKKYCEWKYTYTV